MAPNDRFALIAAVCSTLGACSPPPPRAMRPPKADDEIVRIGSSALEAHYKPYPETPTKRVVDHYDSLGIDVPDDYRWLEDAASPEVNSWIEAQNAYTRRQLDPFPGRVRLKGRVEALLGGGGDRYSALVRAGATVFALKSGLLSQQPSLVSLSADLDPKSEKVVVNPGALDATGGTTIDWFVPSHSGRLLAFSLSKGGSESGDLHVVDATTGKESIIDAVARVHGGTAGGSLAWAGDDQGFYYTRYPRPKERPPADLDAFQQIWFHTLGHADTEDTYVLGKEFSRIAEVELESAVRGPAVLAHVRNGDGGEVEHWYFGGNQWVKLASFEDHVRIAKLAPAGDIFLLRGDADLSKLPAKGLAKALSKKESSLAGRATPVAASVHGYIQELLPTEKKLYFIAIEGGPTRLATLEETVSTLPISTSSELAFEAGDDILFRNESFTEPAAFYEYRATTKTVRKTALGEKAVAKFEDAEVVRVECTSKDQTKVPMSILRKRGTPLDGTNPTWLTAYGGFSISRTPTYHPLMRLWLNAGGVFAEANVRGGDELGEAWHEQGMLTKKQNVFDDFVACAVKLFDDKYTSPKALVIEGRSNGGLLMGAELVEHPELWAAVVSHVGIYDSLRVEQTPNGAFNVTEYGSMKDPAQAKALFDYSPYHHVKDHVVYPPTLLTAGANDARVAPWNSRKMIAKLQAATEETPMLLLRTSANAGHGQGTPLDERVAEATDVFVFVFKALGIPFVP